MESTELIDSSLKLANEICPTNDIETRKEHVRNSTLNLSIV